jgi:hypothetical protein
MCRFFNDAFSIQNVRCHRFTDDDDDELEMICKKAASGPIEAQTRNLPGGTDDNHEKNSV